MKKKSLIYLVTCLSIAVNILLAGSFYMHEHTELVAQYDEANHAFLSKTLSVDSKNDMLINFIPLRNALQEYVATQNGSTGIYFEYLPTGSSISANALTQIKLLSLAKVPLVMSIYKKAERGQLNLESNTTLSKQDIDKGFGTLWQEGEGANIPIKTLITKSLSDSDNTAYNALFDLLTPQEVNEVYENLDIELTHNANGILTSPKNYSSVFRALYLSSFLAPEDSNSILESLSHTAFTDKIPAGVPNGIIVSHKIGVFENVDGQNDLYTDCGIIYAPNRPYILCAFVKGNNAKAQEVISHVSKMVYGYVTQVKASIPTITN